MRRLKARPTALLAVLLLSVGACRPEPEELPEPAPELESPRRGGQAVFASLSDISGVNELVASGTNFSGDILQKLFLPFYKSSPTTKTILRPSRRHSPRAMNSRTIASS